MNGLPKGGKISGAINDWPSKENSLAGTVVLFMRNTNRIGFIFAAVTVMLLAGCSTSRRSHREVTYSDLPALINLDSVVNDRSTWIDGPPQRLRLGPSASTTALGNAP